VNESWEYRVVVVADEDFAQAWERVKPKHRGRANAELEAELNALGSEGWELVAVERPSGTVSSKQVALFFKRRLT
jgi:hypothetical protein